jgi:heat shock protein HslJ
MVTMASAALGAGTPSAGGATAATPLVGTNWVLTGIQSPRVRVGDVPVSAVFGTDNRLSGQNACNSYNSTYTVTGSRLAIDTDAMVTTLANCTPAENRVARAYTARLASVRRFAISGSVLTLTNSSGQALLTFRSTPPAQAILGKWTAISYYTGSAVQSVAIGSTLTAEFTKTMVSGESGCNTFSGGYTTSGDTIDIGPLASTLRACADPAVSTQEQQYLAALELATTFRVTGTRLDLFRNGGTIAVTYEKAK